MIDFDITSTSKEDGETITYHTPVEKGLIIKKLSENTGMLQGQVLDMLQRGQAVSTCFFSYQKAS